VVDDPTTWLEASGRVFLCPQKCLTPKTSRRYFVFYDIIQSYCVFLGNLVDLNMNTLFSRIAYLDSLIYDIFPRGCCFRDGAYADVEGNSVKAIRASYRILRIPGIRRVEVTLAKGKKPIIKI
jgi:hypothetical protein